MQRKVPQDKAQLLDETVQALWGEEVMFTSSISTCTRSRLFAYRQGFHIIPDAPSHCLFRTAELSAADDVLSGPLDSRKGSAQAIVPLNRAYALFSMTSPVLHVRLLVPQEGA
jgi:hypothetical protein